jgi:hypothetical protein
MLREAFLDQGGAPSEQVYARSHSLMPLPGSETFQWRPVFRLAFRSADLSRLNEAEPINADCYFVKAHTLRAPLQSAPVWDGRVYLAGGRLVVAAFTPNGERIFGHIDESGQIVRERTADGATGAFDLTAAKYNPFTGRLWRPLKGGEIHEQQHLYLPIALSDPAGKTVSPEYAVRKDDKRILLTARASDQQLVLAACSLVDLQGQGSPGYRPSLGAGCTMPVEEPTTVFELPGELNFEVVDGQRSQLVVRKPLVAPPAKPESIAIDGRFDDWRNIAGVADPKRDTVSYLDYNPDTDLLAFKVASDSRHLYFYTRVAGRHGHTERALNDSYDSRDRYYFYVYIDVDRNPETGYVPTREDECYYGVALGVDCEPQFEFAGGRFVKTFFGFAGATGDAEALAGRVRRGSSSYHRQDDQGRPRAGYKVEYVRKSGKVALTGDLREGTTDDIHIALSADGSECEMRVALEGFLQDQQGQPIISPGQRIDLAVGVEASGQARGNERWSADNSAVIRSYQVGQK